jgi:hypothetical protein
MADKKLRSALYAMAEKRKKKNPTEKIFFSQTVNKMFVCYTVQHSNRLAIG